MFFLEKQFIFNINIIFYFKYLHIRFKRNCYFYKKIMMLFLQENNDDIFFQTMPKNGEILNLKNQVLRVPFNQITLLKNRSNRRPAINPIRFGHLSRFRRQTVRTGRPGRFRVNRTVASTALPTPSFSSAPRGLLRIPLSPSPFSFLLPSPPSPLSVSGWHPTHPPHNNPPLSPVHFQIFYFYFIFYLISIIIYFILYWLFFYLMSFKICHF